MKARLQREIAKEVHISLKDIGKIIRKITGDEDPNKEGNDEEKEKQKRIKYLSIYTKAFQIFKDKKSLVDVSIDLDCETYVI